MQVCIRFFFCFPNNRPDSLFCFRFLLLSCPLLAKQTGKPGKYTLLTHRHLPVFVRFPVSVSLPLCPAAFPTRLNSVCLKKPNIPGASFCCCIWSPLGLGRFPGLETATALGTDGEICGVSASSVSRSFRSWKLVSTWVVTRADRKPSLRSRGPGVLGRGCCTSLGRCTRTLSPAGTRPVQRAGDRGSGWSSEKEAHWSLAQRPGGWRFRSCSVFAPPPWVTATRPHANPGSSDAVDGPWNWVPALC